MARLLGLIRPQRAPGHTRTSHQPRAVHRGVDANRIALSTRVAAINLRRLIALGLTHGPAGWSIT